MIYELLSETWNKIIIFFKTLLYIHDKGINLYSIYNPQFKRMENKKRIIP